MANAVLSSIPSYGMEIQWYPQFVCNFLDKTVRNFIWKGHKEKGMHMVNWKTITKPCRWGGLGVRVARNQNIVLLGKLIWELISTPDKLWVSVMNGKYGKAGSLLDPKKSRGSNIWNSIMKALDVLQEGFQIKIGDGKTSFWYEPWLLKGPFCERLWVVDIHDIELKIKDVLMDGKWNLDMLYTPLPEEVKQGILGLTPRLV